MAAASQTEVNGPEQGYFAQCGYQDRVYASQTGGRAHVMARQNAAHAPRGVLVEQPIRARWPCIVAKPFRQNSSISIS
jgi:hypothetical protein